MGSEKDAGADKGRPYVWNGSFYLPDGKPSGLFTVSGGSKRRWISYRPYDRPDLHHPHIFPAACRRKGGGKP